MKKPWGDLEDPLAGETPAEDPPYAIDDPLSGHGDAITPAPIPSPAPPAPRSSPLRPAHLQRKAVIYIRQSDAARLSQVGPERLLREVRDLGFRNVQLVHEGDHAGDRPLLADVANGRLGALISTHSALGMAPDPQIRDLLNACAISGAMVISPNGMFNPRSMSDRQALGLTPTLLQRELRDLSAQILGHLYSAQSNGLRPVLPAGLHWNRNHRVDLDPDGQIRHTIQQVLHRFEHTRDAREVLSWLERQGALLPAPVYVEGQARMDWKRPDPFTVQQILTDPMYAGAFGLGPRPTTPQGLIESPDLLVRDHHPGFISWPEYERNQKILGNDRPRRIIDLTADEGSGGFAMSPLPAAPDQGQLRRALEAARARAEEAGHRYAEASPHNHLVKQALEQAWNEALGLVHALSTQLDGGASGALVRHEGTPTPPLPTPVRGPSRALMIPSHADETPQRDRYRSSNPLVRHRAPQPEAPRQEVSMVVVPDWVSPQALARGLPSSSASEGRQDDPALMAEVDALLGVPQERRGPDDLAVGLNRAGVRTGARQNWTSSRVQRVKRYNRERDD